MIYCNRLENGEVWLLTIYGKNDRSTTSGLSRGILFVYGVRRPMLLRLEHASINPQALRLLALTSLITWLSVAACGRWIGFS